MEKKLSVSSLWNDYKNGTSTTPLRLQLEKKQSPAKLIYYFNVVRTFCICNTPEGISSASGLC